MGRIDLALDRLGGRVLAASDDFFAPKERLILASEPEWREGEYTDRGKWMDGWESRRRRTPGADWCVVALGVPGMVESVVVDTTHFTGNHPEACSLDGAESDDMPEPADWFPLLARSELAGDHKNVFAVDRPVRVTHVRLTIHPDGGVARLRVRGRPVIDWVELTADGASIDLASARLGAAVAAVSDAHFSRPEQMLFPGPSRGMFDGWETARRRGPGNDWADIDLAARGRLRRVVVDTTHFKGNAPAGVRLVAEGGPASGVELLAMRPVEPDAVHEFEPDRPEANVDRVRFEIHPDGGVARLRLFGIPAGAAVEERMVELLNSMTPRRAAQRLTSCCASERWVNAMVAARPFSDLDAVLTVAGEAWRALGPSDWDEAFAAHPRIGEQQGRQDPKGESWSRREQARVAGADGETRARLAAGNRRYAERFGRTFIVCAAGRSGVELLEVLEARLRNDSETERRIAVDEQAKITELRIRRMLGAEEAL